MNIENASDILADAMRKRHDDLLLDELAIRDALKLACTAGLKRAVELIRAKGWYESDEIAEAIEKEIRE